MCSPVVCLALHSVRPVQSFAHSMGTVFGFSLITHFGDIGVGLGAQPACLEMFLKALLMALAAPPFRLASLFRDMSLLAKKGRSSQDGGPGYYTHCFLAQ